MIVNHPPPTKGETKWEKKGLGKKGLEGEGGEGWGEGGNSRRRGKGMDGGRGAGRVCKTREEGSRGREWKRWERRRGIPGREWERRGRTMETKEGEKERYVGPTS